MVTKGERSGRELNQEVGVNIYVLLCIKQIINMDLQYSTGHHTQHSVIFYNTEESEKEYTYIYVCIRGIPGGTSGKEVACQCRRCKRLGFNS